MKRVVIDCRRICYNNDGLGFYSLFFTKRILSYLNNIYQIYLLFLDDVNASHFFNNTDNLEIIYLNSEYFNPSIYSKYNSKNFTKKVSELKPDLYISPSFELPNLSCIKIVVIHDLIPILLAKNFRKEKVNFYRKLIDFSVANADLILTPSKNTRNDISKCYNRTKNLQVLYPDIQHVIKRIEKYINHKPPHNRFLSIGIKCPRRNLTLLFDSLKLLKMNGIKIKVLLIGNTRSDIPLHQWISERDIADMVTILGYISDNYLIELIMGGKGILFTSLYEGFGIPLLECLILRKPIICLKNSSIKEVVDNNAIFSKNDPEVFANDILDVLSGKYQIDSYLINKHINQLVNENIAQYSNLFKWIRNNIR